MNFAYSAAATCAMLVLYFLFTMNVGRLRGRHNIDAPAITGHPEFERAFRVQANTLERLIVALPALWIYAHTLSPKWAVAAAAVWVAGRIVYAFCYMKEPNWRGPGMLITFAAELWLLVGAVWGTARLLGV
jgi:glutathione S-transferase